MRTQPVKQTKRYLSLGSLFIMLFVLNMSFNPFSLRSSYAFEYSFVSTLKKIFSDDNFEKTRIVETETNTFPSVEEVKEVLNHSFKLIFSLQNHFIPASKKLFSSYQDNVLQPHYEILLQPPLSV